LVLLTVIFGALLSGSPVPWSLIPLVLLNVFLFLYVAHLNDTFFDLKRGEYEPNRKLHGIRIDQKAYLPRWGFGPEIPNAPLLPRSHYLWGMVVFGSLGTLVALWVGTITGWLYSALAFIGLFLAITYSAGIDRIPVMGDLYWELGVVVVLACGYYVAKGLLDATLFQVAIPLVIALVGFKILDGFYDIPIDKQRGKRTIPALLSRRLGLETIRTIGFIPIYCLYGFLMLILPPLLYPGVFVGLVMALVGHVRYLWRDMEERKGIVCAGFGLIIFLAYSITTLTFVV